MTGELQASIVHWITHCPSLAGVLAWGVRLPDRTSCNCSFSDGFPDASLDNAWRCVADTLQVLRTQRCPVQRLRWVFEHHALHCAVRPDGAFLGVFTSIESGKPDPAALDRMIQQFFALAADSSL